MLSFLVSACSDSAYICSLLAFYDRLQTGLGMKLKAGHHME